MNKRKVALGPGAASLILIVVVLSLCMMAMLTQISARSDYNLCTRSAEMVQRVYELNAQSEQKLAVCVRMWSFGQYDAMKRVIERPKPAGDAPRTEQPAGPSGNRRGRSYDF